MTKESHIKSFNSDWISIGKILLTLLVFQDIFLKKSIEIEVPREMIYSSLDGWSPWNKLKESFLTWTEF